MPNPNELKAAFERFITGTASEADRSALHTAMTSGVLVTGDRAVAIGQNASDVIIKTGDENIVLPLQGADPATVQAALSSITPTRLHQVPPPPADFTGRKDELKELLAAIEQGGVTISGLQGLGGIGKTALALKLVEQLKPRYPNAQLYLDLKGASKQPLSVTDALAHVIRAYHPLAKLPESETELRALYLSVLEGQRAILLMDNAASAEQVTPLIPPTGCLLLVTSRWHFTLPGLTAQNLDAMTAADARALLLAIAPRIGTWADEIAKLCGYLPLALRLAAGALAKYRNLKPQGYAQRLQDKQERLQLIEASLSVSYELLSEQLQDRWRLLAVFPDSFAEDAAAAVWEVAVAQTQQTLGELITASMVEWNETTDRYSVHDLAGLFANAKLNEQERAVGQKHYAMHYKNVLSAADDFYMEGGAAQARGLGLFDLEWANIQAGYAWTAPQGVDADEDLGRLCMAYLDAGANLLLLRQHSRDRIRWLGGALAAARRLNDRANEGNALGNLGHAYVYLGEHQHAIEFYQQSLPILKELGDRRGEGNVLNSLGVAFRNLGRTDSAIEFYEQQLAIAREIGDRRGEGRALSNLGDVYTYLDELQRAIQVQKECLIVVREIGDRQVEGIVLGNLGIAYWKSGEFQPAIELFEQQLTICREIGDLRGEGSALWNMSLALNQLGQRAQAIQYAEQSLVIREQIEDPRAANVRATLVKWRAESADD